MLVRSQLCLGDLSPEKTWGKFNKLFLLAAENLFWSILYCFLMSHLINSFCSKCRSFKLFPCDVVQRSTLALSASVSGNVRIHKEIWTVHHLFQAYLQDARNLHIILGISPKINWTIDVILEEDQPLTCMNSSTLLSALRVPSRIPHAVLLSDFTVKPKISASIKHISTE